MTAGDGGRTVADEEGKGCGEDIKKDTRTKKGVEGKERHTNMMRSMLRHISNSQCRMFVHRSFLRNRFSLLPNPHQDPLGGQREVCTYGEQLDECGFTRAIRSYDPHSTTPTINFNPTARQSRKTYLESDSAQDTPIKLGLSRPGYVNVHPTILRMALVLLLTPINEPGGGKANLMVLEESV